MGPSGRVKEFRKVSGLGPKAYEQSAGFMRISGGVDPLDASAIHPESYSIAEAVLERAAISASASLAEKEGRPGDPSEKDSRPRNWQPN